MEERVVKPFTMWRHFKGARSFVITVAEHSETGETHYLEWNTNVQKVIDYYIDDEGSIWLCIYAPDDSPEAYNEYGEYIGENTDTMWWHKLSE